MQGEHLINPAQVSCNQEVDFFPVNIFLTNWEQADLLADVFIFENSNKVSRFI